MELSDVVKCSTELQGKFVRRLSGKSKLEDVLTELVDTVSGLLNASACSVFMIDRSGKRAVQVAGSGYQRPFNGKNDVRVVPASEVRDRPKRSEVLGLTGWILSTGKPFLASSPEEMRRHPHHRHRKQIAGEDVRLQGFLGVPIRGLHGEVIGVMKAERRLPVRKNGRGSVKPFSQDDELALETMARVAGRCMNYVSVAQRGRSAEAVTGWAQAVIAETAETAGELDEFLELAAKIAADAMQADSCGIFLKDESGKTLTQRAGTGSQAVLKVIRAYPWPAQASLAGCMDQSRCNPPNCGARCAPARDARVGLTAWIAATGRSFHARNSEELEQHCHHRGEFNEVNFPKQEGYVCGAFLGVPLQIGGATTGVIKVENKAAKGVLDKRDFSEVAQRRFEILALDIALSIKRLQSQIPDRNKIIEKAQGTILKILRGGQDIEDLAHTVVKEVRDLFSAGACALFLKEGDALVQPRWAASGWAEKGPQVRSYKLVEPSIIKDHPRPREKVGLTVWIAVKQEKFTASSNTELRMHPHWRGEFDSVNFKPGERCESFMGFPLVIREENESKLVGVLKVETKTRGEGEDKTFTYFNELDERVFELIANSAALAIQNLRLRESRAREAAWREFTAMAAHRVGSESAEIGGAMDQLEPMLSRKGGSKAVKRIGDALDRIDNLVREFTEFAKPPAPKMERVNLNQLCEDAVQGKTKIRTSLRLAPRLPLFWGDRERLLYCLKEMVHNAEKALPDRGALTITTSAPSSDRLRIELADNGPGVPKEVKERIFEPAFKARAGGTGLGLAIVKRTIQEHAGRVFEDGKPGNGAHFVIEMPVREPSADHPLRVLVVEDTPGHREDIELAVKSAGPNLAVVTATNEMEAERLIADSTFDLVITDVSLEKTDGSDTGGLKVLEAVKEKSPDTPVIVVTAYGKLEIQSDNGSNAKKMTVEDRAKELQCFSLIPKTRTYLASLRTAVNRALERHAVGSSI